jgi:phosphatidate cytidylyltransferase
MMPDLWVRGVSALAMITVAALAIWSGGWVLTTFVLLVAAWLLWEWQTLILLISHTSLPRLAWTIGGFLYIVGGAAALLMLANRNLIVPVIGIVIATDTGAYFAGRAIGGPKIAPAISPSKTWAGLIGGMLSAAVVALVYWMVMVVLIDAIGPNRPVLSVVLDQPLMIIFVLVSGAGLAVLSQAGDFFESWMKRKAGVKDSGIMVPGHGGLFDRVDGLLPVSIACAICAQIFMHGSL